MSKYIPSKLLVSVAVLYGANLMYNRGWNNAEKQYKTKMQWYGALEAREFLFAELDRNSRVTDALSKKGKDEALKLLKGNEKLIWQEITAYFSEINRIDGHPDNAFLQDLPVQRPGRLTAISKIEEHRAHGSEVNTDLMPVGETPESEVGD